MLQGYMGPSMTPRPQVMGQPIPGGPQGLLPMPPGPLQGGSSWMNRMMQVQPQTAGLNQQTAQLNPPSQSPRQLHGPNSMLMGQSGMRLPGFMSRAG